MPRDDTDAVKDIARDLADVAAQIATFKGEADAYLFDPSYNALRLRPDGYLESAAIHERLGSEGVEVTDAVLTTTLSELATCGRITLTLLPGGGNNPDQVPVQGGATIHDIEDDLCE